MEENTMCSDGYHKSGNTYFKSDGNTGEYVSQRSNRNGRSRDHLHYYTDNQTGERCVKDKNTGNRGSNGDTHEKSLGDVFREHMGW